MATLEEILNRINEKETSDQEQKIHKIKIHGIEYEVLEMTTKQKRDFIYSRSATQKDYTIGDIATWLKPFIYSSFQLAEFANELVKQKKIKTYYDIVDELFGPDEILEIMNFITDINNIAGAANIEKDFDDIKKQ